MNKPSRPWPTALAVAAIACATARAAIIPPGTELSPRQEMVRNGGAEPDSLDPSYVESVSAVEIVGDLFEGLTATDHHGAVVPGIAESWKQVDATTWVFRLRSNAAWSDGHAVTAGDFVYAWRRILDPKTASRNASACGVYLLHGLDVVGARKPPSELGVQAIDALTLEVKTAGPVPFLPAVVSAGQFSPLPRRTIEQYGRDWTKPGNLVGDGAYVLKDWRVNGRIVIEKSPTYWDAAATPLTRVTYLAVEDDNADLQLYQSGEEDLMRQVPAAAYAALKAQYPAEMHNGLLLGMRFYALNNEDPVLRDVRVRKALSMVIDREVLAVKVTADGQAPLYGLAVRGLAGIRQTRYDWADWPMAKRVAEARRLLVEAGVKPGARLKLTYNTSEYHKKMAIFAASEWKTKLGLDTDLDSLEFKALIRKRHDGDFQVARHGWAPTVNDASIFLALVACGSEFNDQRSCNRRADELAAQGNASPDPDRREALLTEAARIAMEDYPLIPLLQYSQPRLVKPWIGGYDDSKITFGYRSKDFYVIRH